MLGNGQRVKARATRFLISGLTTWNVSSPVFCGPFISFCSSDKVCGQYRPVIWEPSDRLGEEGGGGRGAGNVDRNKKVCYKFVYNR